MLTTNQANNTPRRTTYLQRLQDTGVDIVDMLKQHMHQQPPFSVVAEICIVLIVAIGVSYRLLTPPTVAQPAAPQIIAATARPAPTLGTLAVKAEQDSRPRTSAALVAYDRPDGQAYNAIDARTAYTVVARSGADWTQINIGTADKPNTPWVHTGALLGNAPDVATPVPTAAPPVVEQPQIVAPVPQQQAEPTVASYTGAVVEYPIRHTETGTMVEAVVPDGAPRLCTGFGDARDFDPMYAASPVCHQTAP